MLVGVQAWEAEGTGLLIMERLMNVPPQLSPPLMQAIFDEIQWATEDEPTQVDPELPQLFEQPVAAHQRCFCLLETTAFGGWLSRPTAPCFSALARTSETPSSLSATSS